MPLTFNEDTLRRLEQLALVADDVRSGAMKGDRRSNKRGSSIEFADYRDYTRGDDLRRIDWNVMARLDRPFIKLLEDEEDLAVHILLDGSASMDWPSTGDGHKFTYARRLAAAMAVMALSSGDLLAVRTLGTAATGWGPRRGKGQSVALFQYLEQQAPTGATNLGVSLTEYARRGRRPGLCIIISDLLAEQNWRDGVMALRSRGHQVAVIHLLSRDEVSPTLQGDLKLVDIETGAETELTLDPATRRRYRERLAAWQAEIAAFCAARGAAYVPCTSDTPWDRFVMTTLRQRGLVR